MTAESPEVFYLLGIAHALGKPTIMISQTAANLPFAVSDRRIIQYQDTNIGLLDLRDRLAESLVQLSTTDLVDIDGSPWFVVNEQDLALQRKALYSDSAESRRFAIKFLGECRDKFSFSVIRQIAATDRDTDMAREAFTALYKIDPDEARSFLLDAGLRYQSEYLVRERVVALIGNYPPDDELVNQMIDQLDDSSWGVRQKVCQVLGRWGKSAALGPLQQRLNDFQLQVRIAAAEAFERTAEETLLA